MQHNRKLHISTAGTRKTKHWPETEILWSEFVDRVKLRYEVRRQWKNILRCQNTDRMN